MDEVRTDRLIALHGISTLLVIIRDWPISEKYRDKPELIASLEYLVCIDKVLIHLVWAVFTMYLWWGKDILLVKSTKLSDFMWLSLA